MYDDVLDAFVVVVHLSVSLATVCPDIAYPMGNTTLPPEKASFR